MTASKLKILIATPSAADAGSLQQGLQKQAGERFSVESAANLDSALQRLSIEQFDALLLDVETADGDNVELVKQARRRAPEIPLIILDGTVDDETHAAFIREGAEDVFPKNGAGFAPLIGAIARSVSSRRKEEALHQAQLQIERLGRVLGFGKFEIDLDRQVVTASEAARLIYGLEGCQWPLSMVQDVPLPEYRPTLDRALGELIATGKPYNVEFKIRRPVDGRTADIHSVAEYDAASRKIYGVIKDITEHKRAEDALRENEHRYRLLAENSLDVIWTMSLEGKFTYVSPSVVRLRGYTPDEVLQQSIEQAVCPGSLAAVQEGLALAMLEITTGEKQPKTPYYEVEQPCKDGTSVWTEVSAGLVYDNDRPSHILGVSRDITERRRMQHALAERERELEAVFCAAPVGIVVEIDRVIWEVNDTFCRMTGYDREELICHSIRQFCVSNEDYNRIGTAAYETLAAEGKATTEIETRRKDGSIITTVFSAAALNKDDLSRGVVFTVTDITDRKYAEEALRQSEEKFHLLFSSGNDAVFFHGEDGRFLEVNDKACEALGYSREELLRMTWRDLDDPASTVDSAEMQKKLRENGHAVFEQTHVTKNGRKIPVELSVKSFTVDGRMMILAVSRDITERKQAETEIRRSLSELSATLESTADGILVVDLDGAVQRHSSRFGKMWGIPITLMESGDDKQIVEFTGELLTDRHGYARRIEEISSQPELSSSDVLLLKDGRVFERYSRPQRLEGKIVGRVWSYRDVTEPKKMELRLVRAAEEWRSTFDSISSPISIIDRDFRIVRVNKAYATALNTTPEKLTGKVCFETCHHGISPITDCPHRKTLKEGLAAEIEIHDTANGSYNLVSTYPIFDALGKVTSSVHISQDITERKRLQEKLIVTDRLASVGELAAGIAHEINNPLTGVLGFSELLLSGDVPESIRADLEVIHSEAQRAAEVVKNLLVFARRHTQVRQTLYVNEVIGKVLALRAYEQKTNNIQVVTELGQELPEITADYFQLQQVFLNIVINAEYFMSKTHGRGRLVITSEYRSQDETVRLTFTDDGPGIPPDILPRLFDPFFTTKEVGQGTGLGLSISHGIVQSHGGKIWAESEPGQGATFIIELPQNPPPAPESSLIIP